MAKMKLALVTGASSGLGLELCKLLSQKGYSLLVTGRKQLPPIQSSRPTL